MLGRWCNKFRASTCKYRNRSHAMRWYTRLRGYLQDSRLVVPLKFATSLSNAIRGDVGSGMIGAITSSSHLYTTRDPNTVIVEILISHGAESCGEPTCAPGRVIHRLQDVTRRELPCRGGPAGQVVLRGLSGERCDGVLERHDSSPPRRDEGLVQSLRGGDPVSFGSSRVLHQHRMTRVAADLSVAYIFQTLVGRANLVPRCPRRHMFKVGNPREGCVLSILANPHRVGDCT